MGRGLEKTQSLFWHLLLLFAVVNLQALRGISPLYMVLPLLLYVLLIFKYIDIRKKGSQLYWLFLIYTLYNFYILAISVIDVGMVAALTAAVRAFFVFPLFYLAHGFITSENGLLKLIALYIAIVSMGSISLIYQNIFGPIPWLAEAGMRGGLDRYASILGALPTYGVAGGFALVFLPTLKIPPAKKAALFALIAIGMILTLQKAAIFNLLISLFMVIIIIRKMETTKIFIKLVATLFAGIAASFILVYCVLYDYYVVILNFLNLQTDDNQVYVGNEVKEDLLNRLSGHMLSDVDFLDMVIGIGYRGVGGALGIDGEMGHNAFIDLLLMGGVFYLFLFVLMYILAARLVAVRLRNKLLDGKLGFCIISFLILFAINFPAYTGILINPSLCSVLWIIMGFLSRPTVGCNDPLKTCTGHTIGESNHEYDDGRRYQEMDGQAQGGVGDGLLRQRGHELGSHP